VSRTRDYREPGRDPKDLDELAGRLKGEQIALSMDDEHRHRKGTEQ
jgi:hypothetical protein